MWSRLVSGAGDIKLTKDGNVLLHEMVFYCNDGFKFQTIDIYCILFTMHFIISIIVVWHFIFMFVNITYI